MLVGGQDTDSGSVEAGGGGDDAGEAGQSGRLADAGGHASPAATTTPTASKPYFTKRPHKKSRGGCHSCKTRKVKCDEARPRCRACTLRNEACVYAHAPARPDHHESHGAQGAPRTPAAQAAPATPASTSGRPATTIRSSAAGRDAVRRQRAVEIASKSTPSTGPHLASAILPDVFWQTPSASASSASPPPSPPAAASHTYSSLVRHRGRRQSIDSQTPLPPATATSRLLVPAAASPRNAPVTPSPSAGSSGNNSDSNDSKDTPPSRSRHQFHPDFFALNTTLFPLCAQPLYSPAQFDETDMKLLWFFTTKGYDAFAPDAGRDPKINEILQVTIPHHAFASPFLMDSLLGIAAVEMVQLQSQYGGGQHHVAIDRARMYRYRARAFSGYRAAIEAARPETFPALLACSLLLCALSSQTFREPEESAVHPLYIVDWMIVWRGIGIIVELIRPQTLFASGMAMLFARPPINLDAAARHVPNELLFMVSSIPPDDPDHASAAVYYEAVKILGSLYREVKAGFGRVLSLRIITWFTFLSSAFVDLVRARRPRALVIVAHHLAFTKLCRRVWWMVGIADKEIRDIDALLGPAWRPLLRVPLACLDVDKEIEVVRLLLGNDRWTPDFRYDRHRDRRTTPKEFSLVDREGHVVEIEGDWYLSGDQPSLGSGDPGPSSPAETISKITKAEDLLDQSSGHDWRRQSETLLGITILIDDDDGENISGERVEVHVPICSQFMVRRAVP